MTLTAGWPGIPQFPLAGSLGETAASSIGCLREITLINGASGSERLLQLDDASYTLAYEFVEPMLPLRNYRAELHLERYGDQCTRVVWTALFAVESGQVEQLKATITEHVFTAGLDALVIKLNA